MQVRLHIGRVQDHASQAGLTIALLVYIAGLAAAAVGLASLLVTSGWQLGVLWTVLVLAASAAIAERASVQLVQGIVMDSSISNLFVLFAAVLFGPLAAMLVGALSMAGAFRRPYMRWATYTLARGITGALTGLIATQAAGLATSDVSSIVLATVFGGIAVESLDLAFGCLTYRVRGKQMREIARVLLPVTVASVPLYMPLVGLLAIAYLKISPVTLPLFLAPSLAFQRLFGLYQDQRRLADDLSAVNRRLESANMSFATALVATIDARDRYTAGHSAAVAIYARDIATRLELSEEDVQLAHLSGLVHDIGRIGLPPRLLEKPGALTLDERRQMQEHSAIGERILAKVDDYAEIARIVRHHHERVDGMGYPDGISRNDIPLISRIIAVADAYNAMTSDRPYRDAMPSRIARMRVAQGIEGQFDTNVVAAFEAILAGAGDDYRTATRLDFTFEAQDSYSELISEEAA
jgi:putative nucleotidyltransferase with HDIG domain